MNKFSGETLGLNQFEEMVFNYGCFGDEMIGYEDFTENQKQIIASAWKEAIEIEMDEDVHDVDKYCQETYKVIDGYFDDFVEG